MHAAHDRRCDLDLPFHARAEQRQTTDVRPAQPGLPALGTPLDAIQHEYVCEAREGAGPDELPGRTRGVVPEKLRSQTAEKLNGDPQDLIRAMPAKGDRPAGRFFWPSNSARPAVTGPAHSAPPGPRDGSASARSMVAAQSTAPLRLWPGGRRRPAPPRP